MDQPGRAGSNSSVPLTRRFFTWWPASEMDRSAGSAAIIQHAGWRWPRSIPIRSGPRGRRCRQPARPAGRRRPLPLRLLRRIGQVDPGSLDSYRQAPRTVPTDALMFVNPRGRPVLPGLTCGLPRRRLWPPLAAPPGRSSSLRCGRWTCGFAGGDVAATGECRACHRRPAEGGGGAKGRRATWRRRSGIGGRSGAVPLRGWWPGPGRSGPSCGR